MNRFFDKATEWTGELPHTWRRVRLGACFVERNEPTTAETLSPLSVTKAGVVDQQEQVAKSQVGAPKKVVRSGDFVINSRSDRKGSAGLAPRDGSVSLINIVLTPTAIVPRFAHYLLRSIAFQEEFYRWGSGIVADLWSTRYASMKNIQLPLPSENEQQAIADYLDHETAEIDAFIKDEQQIAVLLEERELAQLERLVAPEHVAWVPLKRLGLAKAGGYSANGAAFPAQVPETGVLKTGAVSKGAFDPSENKLVDDPAEQAKLVTPVRRGTVIVNRANTPHLVGSLVAVPEDHPNLFLSDLLWEVDVRGMKADLLAHFSRTKRYREFVELISVGASSTMKKIRFEDFARLEVPMFSPERESEVLEQLDVATETLRTALDDSHRSVALAKERRSALISAAVTGQLDVSKRMRPEVERIEDEVREMR